MTAPAVVRRWNDPPPARAVPAPADHRVADLPVSAAGGGRAATVARVRAWEQLVRMWRVAPIGAVLLTGLVAHAAVVPHLVVRGAAPDVLLVATVAIATWRGARTGAGFGFAAGLGADVFLATPLGTSALAYTLVGHALGRAARPRPAGSAAALCSPDSTCFACRAGRLHTTGSAAEPVGESPARPSRSRRRAAARRAALRRSIVSTGFGVAAGRLGTAVAATTLGGVPFPGTSALVRMAGVAILSAPLGPAAAAALRRLSHTSAGPR